LHPAGIHIHQVGAAGSVQVGQHEPPGVEIGIELGGHGHAHPLAETAVAQVGPVVDATVVDEHDVVEAVTRHVCQPDAARRIIEIQVGKLVQVMDPGNGAGRTETFGAQALEPQELAVGGHQGVGSAIARQIQHAHMGIPGQEPGLTGKGGEALPCAFRCRFVEPGQGTGVDQ
jgi:hypothetical protein